MIFREQEGRGDRALLRPRHWLIAVVLLAATILIVPIIAGLT